eukprot:m.370664 g.370664  ORF g.370664 m.370664 type:complete len:72 (+) comp54943_c0_seq1:146-361(+)
MFMKRRKRMKTASGEAKRLENAVHACIATTGAEYKQTSNHIFSISDIKPHLLNIRHHLVTTGVWYVHATWL